jgi:hypothetical protein
MKLIQSTIGILAMACLAAYPASAETNFSDSTGTNFSDSTGTNFSDGTGTNFSDGTGTNFSDGTGTNQASSQDARFTPDQDLVAQAEQLASELEACQASNCSQLEAIVERCQSVLDEMRESEVSPPLSNPAYRVW